MSHEVFVPSIEARRLGGELIGEHHARLLVHKVRVEFIFSKKPLTHAGKPALAKCIKVSGLNAFLSGELVNGPESESGFDEEAFFVILIDELAWNLGLSTKQKRALIDHELCHCGAEMVQTKDSEKRRLYIVPHDLEEFRDIVERHGKWLVDVNEFYNSLLRGPQLSLDDIAEQTDDKPITITVQTDEGSTTMGRRGTYQRKTKE